MPSTRLNRFAVSVDTALTVVSLHSTPQQEDGQAYRPLTVFKKRRAATRARFFFA
jgi:hypothetical protein